MIIKAPAKINLAIDVLDKRDDGYHNIDIITLPLELHDSLEMISYPKKYGTYLTCDDASLLCDESNLVYVAYRAMKQRYKFESGLRIKIYKRIPIEAGLAGGSADAAAVINGICKMKKYDVTDQEKIDVAIGIGSDIPYCLFNRPARIRGIGEKIEFLKVKKNWFVLLVQPNFGLSTSGIYKIADTMEKDKPDISTLVKALEDGDEELIAANMKNGLQKAAISVCPEIANIIDKLHSLGLKMVMMSGSGSAVFAMSSNYHLLEQAAKMMDDDDHEVYLTKTACPLQ